MRLYNVYRDGPYLLIESSEVKKLNRESVSTIIPVRVSQNFRSQVIPRNVRVSVFPHDAATLAKVIPFPYSLDSDQQTLIRQATHYEVHLSSQAWDLLRRGCGIPLPFGSDSEFFLMIDEECRCSHKKQRAL